ncbi:S-adenosyl-L-methionine-dependent methyltransferase [Radiomyces spectabilis]|uniref:S-adenosyl-L-methionine-dependent methyltransferase n=1 Tax=Radiomyces spectabilis TaxID=64574 RepID=UPI00221FCB39|nr:S-adenosyl-L-methionine-dependent methyltransferase [Radiomyces spectabilis]KAI8394362.1 S-adenosyl-L-methionine-dependent methyltransferase [Radiomyces spectabilis]
MALINIQPQVKKRLMMKRQENGAPHIPNEALYSLLQRPDEKEPPHVDPSSPQQLERIIDVYCLMTSFMTIYLLFIEILLQDLMDGHAHTFEGYMQLFSVQDDVFYHQDDMFIWYYLYARKETSILHDIRTSIRKTGIQFRSLTLVDTIFSRFYTHHFLELAAQKHQKDHGQFYTPQSVVQFMWNRCLDKQQLMQSASAGHVPRVFDPCMGIGSFLCEFLARQVESCSVIWNHADVLLRLLTTVIPQHVWAVEIDPFAHHLGKLNVMVHLFPFYRRLIELKTPLTQRMIDRLRLFRNDTLKLDTTLPNMDAWEQHQLHRLRDATELKFDYIVTNPPYMIRKTGFITVPDAALYDERVLGGRGTQAYLYFMWICLQRIDDHHGQLCLITPSQWMVLEFAEHLRLWIWKHCKLLEVFQFEPYKVWRKVQTDSLIFLLCKRSFIPRQGHTNTHATLFLRHLSRRIGLEAILHSYEAFDRLIPYTQDPSIASKIVPTDPLDRIHESPHASFAFLYPSTSVSDQLMKSTAHFPRLCDGESRLSDVASTHIPLIWNRGPNTNPVYALVVRTSWAIRTFGQACCDRWLRPVFYWNGKSSARTGKETSVSKEVAFWHNRDSGRLTKKENSPAEAYAPFCRKDPEAGDSFFSFYSLILVDKEGAEELETDQRTLGEKATTCALYHYLKEARQALQPTKNDRTLAWCHYNKCGLQIPVKIVHPINFGYFSRTQPRQRFFVDRTSQCVTNQCIYFTIKPDSPWQSADYFAAY